MARPAMGGVTLAALTVAKGPMLTELRFLAGCLLMAGEAERPFAAPQQMSRFRGVRQVTQETFALAGRGVGHLLAGFALFVVAGQTDCLLSALDQGFSFRGMATMADQAVPLFAGRVFRGGFPLGQLRMAGQTNPGGRSCQHRLKFTAMGGMAAKTLAVTIRWMHLPLTAGSVRMAVAAEGVGLFF